MTGRTLEELRPLADAYDTYVADVEREAKAEGKIPIIDCVELEALGITQAIVDEIHAMRSPLLQAKMNAVTNTLRTKARDAERFAALHRTKADALRAEIETLTKALIRYKKDKAETARITAEIVKAERALATAERGMQKQDDEAARLTAEADAADKAARDTL